MENENYTIKGNVNINNTQKLIGNGSCYFDGVDGEYINIKSDDLKLGTNDFTIETWIYPETQTKTWPKIFSLETNTNLRLYLVDPELGGKMDLYYNSSMVIGTNVTYKENKWTHIALVRKDGRFTLYEDGKNIGSSSSDFDNVVVDLSNLAIGGDVTNPDITPYKGYMDDFAIFNYAKYNDNFTVPNSPCGIIK